MKTRYLSLIVGIGIIAITIGVLMIELDQKKSIVPMQTNQTSVYPSVSNIIIPPGAEDPTSGKNYEPRYLVVVLGINSTVKWTNESPSAAHAIVAENQDDPLFWNATRSTNGVLLYPGKSFNFTFTKAGEFQYDTEPHPWMYGWVLVLPQSAKNATTTVLLNTSSGIPGPCVVFGVPCPNNPSNPNSYNFTAQKFGQDIYIEEMTINGVDTYAILKPNKDCYYPQGYGNTCTNPDDLAILRLVGVNTSIPQEYVDITVSGLQQQYAIGEPISFEIKINGYGYDACEIPYVSVLGYNGSTVWQSLKTPWISCIPGRGYHNTVIEMNTLGGPFSINQTGTYTVHVDYASNSTEAKFDVVPKTVLIPNTPQLEKIPVIINGVNSDYSFNYTITGGEIEQAKADMVNKELILSMKTTGNGTLVADLPRALIDSKINGQDSAFIVLQDGTEVRYNQTTTSQSRILSISFQYGVSQIEITAPASIR